MAINWCNFLSTTLSHTTVIEGEAVATITQADMDWMAGYVLGIYRLIRASVNEYKTQIAARIGAQLKAITSGAPDMTEIVDIYVGWIGDKGYNTLVAIFDMFFHRFPNHKHANLRIGTTGSRFRDCAALISYGYLMDILGLEHATDVMDWVFVEQIGSNIDKMMTSLDELEDPYSYFPYHVDLNLVTKSSYSATANPHFFEWVHLIGSILRAPRSMNARHISDSRGLDILANATCVAYVFASTFNFSKVYTVGGEAIKIQEDEDEEHDDADDEIESILKSRDPTSWCVMLISEGGRLPKKVKMFLAKVVSGITEPREGTIEANLVNLAPVITKYYRT